MTPPPSTLAALLDARNIPDIPSISRLASADADGVLATRGETAHSLEKVRHQGMQHRKQQRRRSDRSQDGALYTAAATDSTSAEPRHALHECDQGDDHAQIGHLGSMPGSGASSNAAQGDEPSRREAGR